MYVHSYQTRLKLLRIESLEDRRRRLKADLLCVYKMLLNYTIAGFSKFLKNITRQLTLQVQLLIVFLGCV